MDFWNKYKNSIISICLFGLVLSLVGFFFWGWKGIFLALFSGTAAKLPPIEDDKEVLKAKERSNAVDRLARAEFDRLTSERVAANAFNKKTKFDMDQEAEEIDRESERS